MPPSTPLSAPPSTELPSRDARGPRLVVVEAPPGPERRRLLADWLATVNDDDEVAHLVSCDFDFAGPWAGLKELLDRVVGEIERDAPELLHRHAHELSLILPRLRPQLQVANLTLTDVASPEEKTRNYPMDRAFRLLHGVVEMLTAWHRTAGHSRWTLVLDDFDRCGALVRRCFTELMRRRGEALGLTLVVAGEAGAIDGESLACVHRVLLVQPPIAVGDSVPPPPEATRRARELEAELTDDEVEMQDRLPQLIYWWLHSETPERAAGWQALAFGEYNHFGFYEDALRYGRSIVDSLDRITGPGKLFTRWNLVGALANCHLALGEPEAARDVIEAEGLPHLDNAADEARAYYVLALIHSRFMPQADPELGERLIADGIEALTRSDLGDHDRYFLHVFLLNGLAFIRHRQGRPEEALELCQQGFELLQKTLDSGAHRLHRSVLLYNIAQVYAALGSSDAAIDHLSQAIEYDPNYSEYYNDRGNAYLKLGRYDAAITDYRQAIELSAPYQEVWTNLGQALKLAGRPAEAAEAYGRALDLDATLLLPRLGRAQAREAAGDAGGALADYTAALEIDDGQPLALANRASLHFGFGHLDRALADLDRAVDLAPREGGLRFNRALVLADLDRRGEAAEELRSYLALSPPDAEDRAEVEARLAGLESAA